jgi:hypothetical protein
VGRRRESRERTCLGDDCVGVTEGDGTGAVVVAAGDPEVAGLLGVVAGDEDADIGGPPQLDHGRLHDAEHEVPPAGAVALEPGLPRRGGGGACCWRGGCGRHYRNPALCRVPEALLSAFYRALGKADFAECRPRQSPALGKEIVYRVPGTRHRQALGKDCCAEGQALGKHGSRQRAVSGRLPRTAVSLCRVSNI